MNKYVLQNIHLKVPVRVRFRFGSEPVFRVRSVTVS